MRSFLVKAIVAGAALSLGACADDASKPQEPVAPTTDTSVYGEDPQLAAPEERTKPGGAEQETGTPNPEDYDADTGALTSDPFGAPRNVPKMRDKSDDSLRDVPETPAAELDVPAEPPGLDGVPQQNSKIAGKTPKAAPKVPAAQQQAAVPPRTAKQKPANTSTAGSGIAAAMAGKRTKYVVPKQLNVRAKPDAKSKVVRNLKAGDKITCQPQGDFCKIKDGEFVRSTQLSDKPTKK